jgi:hypothetical protein
MRGLEGGEKIVFSTTLTQVGWNSELFKEISSKKSISSKPSPARISVLAAQAWPGVLCGWD